MNINKSNLKVEDLLGEESSFKSMSPKEREYFLQILQEEMKRREDTSTPELIRPIVPIETWIESEYYVGKDVHGIYPFWKDFIVDVFREDRKPEEKINQVILGGCFTGDTRVDLLDGRSLSFRELVDEFGTDKEFWVYSCDKNGNVVPGKAHNARMTKRNSKIVEVVLDNGSTIRCTPDHKFLKRDNLYCRADELAEGDSLMPLYKEYTRQGKYDACKDGYERVYNPGEGVYRATHTIVCKIANRDAYEYKKNNLGTRDKYVVVHHRDFNKRNNAPENLTPMGNVEHILYHASKGFSCAWSDPVTRERMSIQSRDKMLRLWNDPEFRAMMDEVHKNQWDKGTVDSMVKNLKLWWDSDEGLRERNLRRKRLSDWNNEGNASRIAQEFWDSIDGEDEKKKRSESYAKRNKERSERILSEKREYLYSKGITIDVLKSIVLEEKTWGRVAKTLNKKYGTSIECTSHMNTVLHCLGVYDRKEFTDSIGADWYVYKNHKVAAVNILDYCEDVYDIEVDEYHNFFLSAGVCVSNSIGIGKSTCAEIIMLRKLYELSCWKNINALFDLMSKTSIMFLYFSVNKTQAERTGFGEIRSWVDRSPYFKENFPRRSRLNDILIFPEGITFAYGSGSSDSIGMSVIGTIMDEANFSGGRGDTGNAERASEMYAGIVNRANSRFIIRGGENYSLNILVSSATTENSVTERQIAASKDDPHTIVCAPSQWEVKPDKFSKKFFFVLKGTDYLEPQIIRSTDDVNNFRISEGMKKEKFVDGLESYDDIEKEIKKLPEHQKAKFLRVPEDLRSGFETNIMRSLQDMGGVSIASTGKLFNSVAVYNACIKENFHHPFVADSIIISTGDTIEIKDYLRSDFRLKHPERPRFIHIDQSFRTDDTGISCVYIDEVLDEDGVKKPVFGVDFMLQINPPNPPKKIAIYKIRNFVVFLATKIGMKFGMISYDIFNSEESRQILEEMGYNVKYQSVDRTDKAYLDTVEVMYEGRLRMYDYKIFRKEIFNVIHYRDKRKVDHPVKNSDGCLLGDTKIKLLDGSYRTIESLVGEKDIEVYGCLEDGRIIPAVASRVWKTKEVSTIVRVTLDSGELVECTENHPFMLRDGSYLRADELEVGMSLMPLRYDFNGKFLKGYERVWDNFSCRWRYTHSLVDEFYNGSLPEGYLVHHYDVNRLNNTRNNLQRKTREEHGKIHAMISALGNTPENVEKRAKSLSENSKERKGLPRDFPVPYWVYKKLLNSWYITDEDREKAKSDPYVIIEKYSYYKGNEEELRKHKRELALNNESFLSRRFNSPSDEAVEKRIKSYRENHDRKFDVDYSFELHDCEIEYYLNMSSLSKRDKKHIRDNPKILLDSRFQDYIKNKVARNKAHLIGIISKSSEGRKRSSDNMTYLNTQGYWKSEEGIKRRKELARTQLVEARKKRMDREDLEWISRVDKNIPIVSVSHARNLYGGGSVAVERRLKIMGINFSDNLKIAEKMSDEELRSIKLPRNVLNRYLGKYNHKVRSIEIIHLNSPVPVYDMEVPSTHNFALAAGVFVHNSVGKKDVADSLVGAIENAIQFKISDGAQEGRTLDDFLYANDRNIYFEPDAMTAEEMVDKQIDDMIDAMEADMGGITFF